MPTFSVRMFAYLRDRHGEQVEVESLPTVASLLEGLTEAGVSTRSCRLSVNQEFARGDEELKETDEIALIPPVSGG